jgi:hypothetical protein
METEKQPETSTGTDEVFEFWSVVELLGRQMIAGRVTEQFIAGVGFVRVDVPEVGDIKPFTKFYSPKAIYAITPVEESLARSAASRMRARPVDVYVVPDSSRQLESRDYDDDDRY